MRLPPWEYLFPPFTPHKFPDLFTPIWVASLVLLVVLVVLYNVRTRALHRHAPYLDMWEWLLWTGITCSACCSSRAVFAFDFIVLLVILVVGLAVMVWVRFRALPAAVRGVRAAARAAALLHHDEVRPARGDDPAEDRPPGEAPPLRRGSTRCRSRSAGSGSATAGRTGRPARSGSAARSSTATPAASITELAFARGGRIEPHSNPNTTWFIVIEGGGWSLVGDERLRVAAGEAVLWPAGRHPRRLDRLRPHAGVRRRVRRRRRRGVRAGSRGRRPWRSAGAAHARRAARARSAGPDRSRCPTRRPASPTDRAAGYPRSVRDRHPAAAAPSGGHAISTRGWTACCAAFGGQSHRPRTVRVRAAAIRALASSRPIRRTARASRSTGTRSRPPRGSTAPHWPRTLSGPRSDRSTRHAEHGAELAEDPGGRAPDVEPVDPVAAVAERPVAIVRSTISIGAPAGTRRPAASGSGRPRPGRRVRTGARSAIATTGVMRKSLTGMKTSSSAPTTRTPAAPASRPISSPASRSAVAAGSGVAGSALPPGKLTSPLWWPSYAAPLGQDDPRASPAVVREDEDEHGGRPGRRRSARGAAGGARP